MDEPMDASELTSGEALRHFMDGMKERLGPNTTVTSTKEKRELKRRIARKMGVEEEYHPNLFTAYNQAGEDAIEALRSVEDRYDELLNAGKIEEDLPSPKPGSENIYDQINRRILGDDWREKLG